MKRSLAGLFALMLVLGSLYSCTPKDNGEDTESDTDLQQSETDSESVEIDGALIFKSGEKTAYRVVYEDGLGKSVQSSIDYAIERLNQLFEGIELKAYSVSECPKEDGALEILIGDTDRSATASAAALITKDNEYVVKLFADGTLCICGTDEVMLKKGISYFMDSHAAKAVGYLALEEELEYHGSQKNRAGWKLSAPVYQGGDLSELAYNTGYGLDLSSTAGQMQVIRKTDAEDFSAYLTKLSENGYEKLNENEVNGNRYVTYRKSDVLLYTYHLPSLGETRVIEDRVSVPESSFEYSYTPTDGEKTVFYQYSLMASPSGTVKDADDSSITYDNSGMFYVIRLADNSVVLVDGGTSNHANDYSTEALLNFLYEITGTPQTEKVRIACVFITHAHDDHVSLSSKLITKYSDKVEVERAMYNIPAANGANPGFVSFASFLKENYPSIKFLKPHTGQSIQLADATFHIVLSHEDLVDVETGKTLVDDYNNYSTIMKITVNESSVILLGDWGGNMTRPSNYDQLEKYFLEPYKTENGYDFLECGAVQVAHHSFNHWMGNIYEAIKAKVVLLPTSDTHNAELWYFGIPAVISQTKKAGAEKLCFHGRYLIELNFTDEGITVTENDPVGVTEAYKAYLESHKPIDT